MFHSFFNSLARSRYLFFFSHSFSLFCSQPRQKSRQFCKLFFFLLLIIIRSGLLVEIRWSMCMSKSHRSLRVSFSRTDVGLCKYHLFIWSDLNFLHISHRITLPTQSWLVLFSFCANLLHPLIMGLMVSSLSVHHLGYFFDTLRSYCLSLKP